ncbi:MAG TPA: 1,4-alpha-glucan branching protein GlgB [Burkholderiales bacterium]|nr:1,4-alpha-glucan branching protein GlgB [Burkholderiales bacterium]
MKTITPDRDRDALAPARQEQRGRFSDYDAYLFKQGSHTRLHERLGAHLTRAGDSRGAQFSVWAPNAAAVSVIGDFNDWHAEANFLRPREDASGIWEGYIAGAAEGDCYKYRIVSRHGGYQVDKSDPYAFCCEAPPRTASRLWRLDYDWHDGEWMRTRRGANALGSPISVYEVHLGSWRRDPERPREMLNYRELAHALADYVQETGFTHVELMPVAEHPFYGSWGYQSTAYFAPTARYGSPQDFMYFVDHLHQRGIGVILDWVPSHFPGDEHGLAYFDGTHLYEHADTRQGFHPEWNSYIFNYGRHEVRSFLASSALFWLETYHVDGLRVDAVASMLYLDYARRPGEWIPNTYGGNENLEAVALLRHLNEAVYRDFPDAQTIAEESTAWPAVSRPVYVGGLGFGMKWNMGWMHDTLDYFSTDALFRKYHHDRLTFSAWYAFSENFVLPLSHDEVVHGKGSMIGKMPGDNWQQFANLRCLYGYMWGHPGKKLLFMGGEFGQRREWQHEDSLEWHVLQYADHRGVRDWIRDLNRYYRATRALHEQDFEPGGFEWVDFRDGDNSVVSFLRKARSDASMVLVICNFTPIPRPSYVVGVPYAGYWREALNSDARDYGGSGMGNLGGAHAVPATAHGRPYSLTLTLPPLSVLLLENPG